MDLHLKELSLFSGAGGGLLGTTHLLGWETVCYVEWDDYASQVLQARIKDGYLHDAPIWSDVSTFDAHAWRGCVDVITAGFPCQPFSVAGAMGAGLDERNGWPDTARVIRDVRPQHVYLENVSGLLAGSHGYFGTVLSELAALGYDARWGVLSAADVGAPHRRDRLWIHGYANGNGESVIAVNDEAPGVQGLDGNIGPWTFRPELARVADGLANGLDRIRAIGNGQVPLVAATAWERLR